jgi:diguanylate cyclase (GGDEF)-like protein/PAS domain S-box-containing protein
LREKKNMVAANERALRADRDRLERVLEASGLGLWELDLDTGEFHVDARCARNLGYGPGQLKPSWDTGVAIIHPDDAIRVSRIFEAHLRGETQTLAYETRMLTHDRAWTWVSGHGRIVRDTAGRPTHVSGTVKNIDAERAAQETLAQANERLQVLALQLQHQALHDPLTGLLNRRGFEQALERLLQSARDAGCTHALCYLDLDHFKVINDTCGHAAGDELLRQLPPLLQARLPARSALARIGGDEFAILLEDCDLEQAAAAAHALRDAVRAFRFVWQERAFGIGVSVGVVAIGSHSRDNASVLAAADAACYVAKDRGPHHVHVSLPNDLAILRKRGELRWVARIKAALEQDEFRLYYMSIAALAGSERPRHHEVLLRLLDDDGGVVLPGAFLPAAERYQLMPQVDRWVIAQALAFIGRGLAERPALREHRFGINVSGDSLRDDQLLGFIRQALARHGVPPPMIYFEFTETAAIANLGAAVDFMHRLREMGCQLALDDFGSGMSSFSYLKHLPVDFVKIDGGFIREIVVSPLDQAIVRAVQSVGAQMGIATIAEYVENGAIRDCLREMGIQYAQGYAIGAPLPLEDFTLLNRPMAATA